MTAASNSEARKRAAVTSAHIPTTADVKAAYCVAGMFTGNYATAYRDGLKRFGPEFDAWLAGIAASNPTAPEPTGTLEGAPGANSEALAALITWTRERWSIEGAAGGIHVFSVSWGTKRQDAMWSLSTRLPFRSQRLGQHYESEGEAKAAAERLLAQFIDRLNGKEARRG
ncbi:hypothetical protein [Pimelobacter simplex]|uniref:hypothetical protein n=1 Tax=Nocardioides simplex TaxID=2045 RepID=UPI003AB054B5